MTTARSDECDLVDRFMFEHLAVRGEIVHLGSTWRTVLERRDYPPVIRTLLGEAMAATVLLSAVIKFDGQLSLQLQGKGPLQLLLVQCTSAGTVRGLARWQEPVRDAPLHELSGGGTLVINIDPSSGEERYQGIVELTGDSLADALEHYFIHSEQLATRLLLVANEDMAAGLLLQRLPGESADPDAWDRIRCLGATLTREELLALDGAQIVHRLFHDENVRFFEPLEISFRCSCSRERTANLLRSLGYDDVQELLETRDVVTVDCEFCGLRYAFDVVDVEALFSVPPQPNVPDTRH